jgi:hypothetical protein
VRTRRRPGVPGTCYPPAPFTAPLSPDLLVTGLYLAVLACLGAFGLHRLWMSLRFRWPARVPGSVAQGTEVPIVTVQLPLYNERTVAARLIRAVAALEHPAERLEIQVLDDSTDETREIVDHEVAELRRRGLHARVLRRAERTGFKAGALAHGLREARGSVIAIFDADFRPRPDFLRRLLPELADPRVGMVQARWEHTNRDEGLLTRAQATLLDGHFVIEHTVRHASGLFFNFNGTAGLWRREAIEQAGGWQHDTLTEDLDLSYRAQLAGWRFVYRPDVGAPSEVPPDLAAFQGQQRRWAKGSVQVARKLGARIAGSAVPRRVKLESAAHLGGNAGYPFVLALAVLLPLVVSSDRHLSSSWNALAFAVCTLSVVLFYDRSQRALGRTAAQRLLDVPAAMALGVGMSVRQTRAVLEGLFGHAGEFVRTPKRGDAPSALRYRALARWPLVEAALAAWMSWGLFDAARNGRWESLPFLGLFFGGFTWVATRACAERLGDRRRPLTSDRRPPVCVREATTT